MARVRSPSYPSYPLDEAVANARKIYDKDRRAPIDRTVVAAHLGYKSLNGAADKSLATMMQYGMFEKVAKGEVRVSQGAVDILFPDTPSQRISALRQAAASPPLFRALNERFPDGPPSNETLRAYLLREAFNDRALGPVIAAYTKTSAYLAQEGASESSIPPPDERPDSGGQEVEIRDDGATFGGARLDDLVQWESCGVLQFERPKRVRLVTEDGQWVAVEGSETGIPMAEVTVQERAGKPTPPAPPPPRFTLEREPEGEKTVDGETEWIRSDLGSATKVRLIVTGQMGPKQIGKLIKLLKAQQAVLSDDDDEADED